MSYLWVSFAVIVNKKSAKNDPTSSGEICQAHQTNTPI